MSIKKHLIIFSIVWGIFTPWGFTVSSRTFEDDPLPGEISGKILDAETGAALTGVNIVIIQSSYGAASSQDGIYLINKVPPGLYK